MPKKPKKSVSPDNPDALVAKELLDIAAKQAGLSKQDKTGLKDRVDEEKKKIIPKADAKKWRERIKRSEKLKKPFTEDAERFQRMYQGDYSDKPGKRSRNFEQMNVNILYSYIEIITAAVFSGLPVIKVRPKYKPGVDRGQADIAALNAQAVIHYWLKELAADDELRDVLFDRFFGFGVTELGWETSIVTRQEKVEESTEGELAASGDATSEDEVGDREDSTEEVETDKDQPFIIRRDPKDVFFDPDARRRRDCRWYAVRDVIKYNDFLESPKYTDAAKKVVKPTVKPDYDLDKTNRGDASDNVSEKEWVEIYTIYDKENYRIYVITKNYDNFINTDDPQGEPWPYDIEYKNDPFPLCIFDGKKDARCPYTWSEFKAYEAQIHELNKVRSAIAIHVHRALPKTVYTASAGDKHKIQKLMNATSDQAVELDDLNSIKAFEHPKIELDLYQFNEMAMKDLTNVSGISEYEAQAQNEMTATEAQIRSGQNAVRKSMLSREWEGYLVEICSKLFQLCQQHMDTAIAVQIAGPNGLEWIDVNNEQIQGEFEFDIEPGTMEYKNEALRQQQLLKFVELTRDDPNVNRRKIVEKVAKELDLAPEEIMLSQEEIASAATPPEPSLKFKPIDPESIDDPAALLQLVMTAFQQNGIQFPPAAAAGLSQGSMVEPGGSPHPEAVAGKDLSGITAGANGNPNMPALQGNMLNNGGNA